MSYNCSFVLKDEGGPGWAARACDSCRSAPRAVYCRADEAYLCAGCDARVHAANRVASRHERVWVCESCERAPAAITCRADAAALCAACDADVHSANPLASRHQRVPVLPVPPAGCVPVDVGLPQPFLRTEPSARKQEANSYDDEAASWLLISKACNQNNNGSSFYGEVDEYLDLVEYNTCNESQYQEQLQLLHQQPQQSYVKSGDTERLVPYHSLAVHEQPFLQQQQQQQRQQQSYELDMEYEASSAGFNQTASLGHSVSFTSMDMSIVPRTTVTDISNSQFGSSKEAADLFAEEMHGQLAAMDREAKVHRYREKKKTRRFDKTIRYASRKAYAEARPRIKGRFAKRSDMELEEVDQMFSTSSMMYEGSYGIVPSF